MKGAVANSWTLPAQARKRFVTFASAPEPAPRTLPDGVSLFAIGDLHGHLDHLRAMLEVLGPRMRLRRDAGLEVHLVVMGDYIDRGPSSIGVLELLANLATHLEFPVHCLRGNHDAYLIDFLLAADDGLDALGGWLQNGGDGTLREFDVDADRLDAGDVAGTRAAIRSHLSDRALSFLMSLQFTWRCDAWVFVHAGIEPDRPLPEQSPSRWLWIREPFLSGTGWAHDCTVVHGHTIRGPEVLAHRIATDSGVYKTGVLTGLELAAGELRFHLVSDGGDLGRFRSLPARAQGREFKRTDALAAAG